jgi:hypothetical protein
MAQRLAVTVEVDGRHLALFVRGFGLVLVAYASTTVASYAAVLQRTAVSFPFSPWHHLPIPIVEPDVMERLRIMLMLCGGGVAAGCLPRLSLTLAAILTSYFLSLDRSFYNNHFVLIAELCALLALLDTRVLHWPWTTARAPLWQLHAVRWLVLSPFVFGCLAKLNLSWLLDAQPVTSWADQMLGALPRLGLGAPPHVPLPPHKHATLASPSPLPSLLTRRRPPPYAQRIWTMPCTARSRALSAGCLSPTWTSRARSRSA